MDQVVDILVSIFIFASSFMIRISLSEVKFWHVNPPKSLGTLHVVNIKAQIFSKDVVVAPVLILVNLFPTTVGTGAIHSGSSFLFPQVKMEGNRSVIFIRQWNVVRI